MRDMKTSQLLINLHFAQRALEAALEHHDVVGIKSASKEITEISEEIDRRIPVKAGA